MNREVKARLAELDARIAPLCSERDREGLKKLVPSSAIILGARVPKLRQLAKELWSEWEKPPLEELIALMDVVCRHSHPELALEIARPLLADPEPMVGKAVGFALREACRAGGGDLVFDFLMEHRETIHRRTLTESLKKLPAVQQAAFRR